MGGGLSAGGEGGGMQRGGGCKGEGDAKGRGIKSDSVLPHSIRGQL